MSRQFILIMTDTTRKDMLGCYGDPVMQTPNLDKLAEEGIRFDRAYTCQPVCGPARGAIFTGLAPHTNGVYSNSLPLGDNVKTIGQRLNDNGVHSAYIGKWHLDGGDYFGLGICPDGWDPDYWYDMCCYLKEMSDEDRYRSRQTATCFEEGFSEEFTYAHKVVNRATDFLKKNKDTDFFLTVSLDEPHGPFLCPAPYNSMYDDFIQADNPAFSDTLEDKPLYQRLWAGNYLGLSSEEIRKDVQKKLSIFYGCNTFADYEIGRVLRAAEEFAPDAIIVYTSDHGDMMGAHCLSGKNAAIYDEVANIPLIIKGGAKGAVVKEVASHIDLAPTIMDYFGLPIPVMMEGRSILPQISDPTASMNDAVFTEFTRYEVDHDGFGGYQPMRAIITNRYKLAIHQPDIDEFYDLETDPHEVKNLIFDPAYAEIRDALHDKLLEHMNVTRDPLRGYQWAARSWRKDMKPDWENFRYTRQRENEEYEPRQLDYDTGLPMVSATRTKDLGTYDNIPKVSDMNK